MTLFDTLILALIEGLTEFLPVSSTGHLILSSKLLQIAETDFVVTFNIVIQLGAVLAVVLLYKDKLLQGPKVWKNILLAFLPTAVIAFTIYNFIRDVLLVDPVGSQVTVWSLFIGGVIIILLERFYFPKRLADTDLRDEVQIEDLSTRNALTLGVIQTLAVIPGVSRSGATIFGGMALGLNRRVAAEFSFLLAIPTMTAASGYDLLKSGADFNQEQFVLLAIGFVAAFLFAYVVIKLFLRFVQTHTFMIFGWYRIAIVALFWLIVLR